MTGAALMTLACRVEDVPIGEGRTVVLGDRPVALFHLPGGAWYAIDAACPHRGGPLADGIVSDRAVICPLHERRYDLATGEALTDGEGVAAHPIELRGDEVYVGLGTEETRAA
jgi:nitrite reductase (NADH) small subunit